MPTPTNPSAPTASELLDEDFGAPADPNGAPPAPDAAAPATEFTREIDLGDGSGKQVFRAATAEELIDKLAEAQANASRHIKQLTREARTRTAAVPDRGPEPVVYAPRALTPQDEFVIAQNLTTAPSQAVSKAFEAVTGMTPAQLADAVNRLNALQSSYDSDKAAMGFVADHMEDYNACPENSAAITQFLSENKLPATRNNLEFAFETLTHRGVLVAPEAEEPGDEPDASATPTPAAPARIERPATRQAGGLSGRRTAAAPTPSLAPTDAETMPLDALRARIVAAQRSARA